MWGVTVRWPGRRKAWTAGVGAFAFVLASAMVLSQPAPLPPPTAASVLETTGGDPVSGTLAPTSPVSTTSTGPATAKPTPTASVRSGAPSSDKGIIVYATPIGRDTMSVTETVRFTHPQTVLVLSPPRVAAAGADFHGLVPKVSQIELLTDGVSRAVPSAALIQELKVPVPPPGATRVDVRYLLSGMVSHVAQAAATASALVSPLIDGAMDNLPVSYVIGAAVQSFACPEMPQGNNQCADAGGSQAVGLISNLPSGQSLLVVGLDLPGGPVTTPPTETPTTPPTDPPTTPPDPPTNPPDPPVATDPTTPPVVTTTTPPDPPTTPPDTGTPTPPPADPAASSTSTPSPLGTSDPGSTAVGVTTAPGTGAVG
ncbi:MAG: hypothetical protein ABI890_02645 [Lapillicoccus sp.]